MSMVHDNRIKGYRVDFEAQILTMNTIYYNHANETIENTDVVFAGYLTHVFNHVTKDNIIFDIEEYPIHLFLEYEYELLKANKNYGWPVFYNDENGLSEFLQSNQYKVFQISSSCGLCGWVLAKQMDIIVDEQPFNSTR